MSARTTERRRHDAQASRQALLEAAGELFEARGYDATTVRDIGERARVDPALIARYFGGKEGLYLATFEGGDRPAPTPDPHEFLARILRRTETRGLGPVTRATVSPTLTDAMRGQVRDILSARAVEPLADALAARGVPDARLRAELVVATALGISLTRAGGTLPALRDASVEELLALLEPVVDVLRASR
jgi:AcrR family transcriptional regulator